MNPDIERAKEILINEYHPDRIILFGSHARGEIRTDSDIDLLVICDREKNIPRPKRGLQALHKLGAIHVPLDVLFFSHSEFAKYQSIPQSFNATVSREGVLLYEQ